MDFDGHCPIDQLFFTFVVFESAENLIDFVVIKLKAKLFEERASYTVFFALAYTGF
jgi:hypothetical protein